LAIDNGRPDSFLKGTDFTPFKKGIYENMPKNGFKRHKMCAFYFSRTLGLKMHFVTNSPDALKIPLKELGLKVESLQDQFGFKLNPNPNPCQSAKVTTIGWGFGTVKSMDSEKLLQAVRETLKIPDHVTLGAQWRTIADKHGKKYPWPKEPDAPRPPQALHFDIDDAYIGVWYPKFSKLWKKGATKKVNYLQIRLIPCFTTSVGKSLTPVQHASTVYTMLLSSASKRDPTLPNQSGVGGWEFKKLRRLQLV
jgi:hypothetical protein